MIKRAVKASLRKAYRYMKSLDGKKYYGNFANEDYAYASINRNLASMQAAEGGVLRPNYTWGVLQGAHLARALGVERISVVEFGVAGGLGLVGLERAAELVEPMFGVKIDVHGFDTGRGLPKPLDYRDLPNIYAESEYAMDQEKLRARLKRAKLHLGLVADTIGAFLDGKPAPLAFASFDFDYYTSTMDAFKLLEADHELLLPRVHCYFDDIMGFTCSEFTGERLAITDFNDAHATRKISPLFGLKYFLTPEYAQQQWAETIYLAHFFDHPRYNDSDGLVQRIVGGHTELTG